MNPSAGHKFAAFIITKDRSLILLETIKKLLDQSLPPVFILVVDNGSQSQTQEKIILLNDKRILHHRVGYNSGPAGGAYWGMKLLFEMGYEWVLWVDDDDPPKFVDLLENLFTIVADNDSEMLGMVGSVGERFDVERAKIIRFNDNELKGYLSVDTISGNMFPLVNRRVFGKNILPNANLFFGFEDLDFGLSLKRSGFNIITSGELHFKHRALAGRLNLNKTFANRRYTESLWREYYSVRSLVYILIYKEKNLLGLIRTVFRNLLKCFFVFKYGFSYGLVSSAMILRGLFDGMSERMGMRILPVAKKITA
jgi:GT2 family glycosyltransferase